MPDANLTGNEIISWLLRVLVIVVGWVVVHILSEKRDINKARREMVVSAVGELLDKCDEIYEAAHKYHLSKRDEAQERRIKMALSDLSKNIVGLAPICNDNGCLTVCRQSIINLRKAVTQEHFEDEHQSPLIHNDPQLDQILSAIMAMKGSLMTLRNQQYSNKA